MLPYYSTRRRRTLLAVVAAATAMAIGWQAPEASSFVVSVPPPCFLASTRRRHQKPTMARWNSPEEMAQAISDSMAPLHHHDDSHPTPQEEQAPQLGIAIGQQMAFTADEKDALKDELAAMIDATFAGGIRDCQALASKWQRDLRHGHALRRVELAMYQQGAVHQQAFDLKVDHLVGTFLNETSVSRDLTHRLAAEDVQRQVQEARDERAQQIKQKQGPTESWYKTNDPWDQEWDEW